MNWKNCFKKIIFFVLVVNSNISALEVDNCTICLGSLKQSIEYGISIPLPCQHCFHEKCIEGYFSLPETIEITTFHKTLSSKSCPICRFNMVNKETFKLYKEFLNAEQAANLSGALSIINNLSKQMFNEDSLRKFKQKQQSLLYSHTTLSPAEIALKITKYTADIKLFQTHLIKKLNFLISTKYYKYKSVADRLKFLKEIYASLYDTNLIKNNIFRSLFGRLLRKAANQVYLKSQLIENINFFKEDKNFCRIITQQFFKLT